MSLSSGEGEFFALTTGIAEGMVTNHLLQELGHDAILMNHVDSQSAKAWASKRGLRRMRPRDAEVHACARRCREEVDESRIDQHEAERSRFDTHLKHTRKVVR